jgi:hypothetical protein
MGNPRRGRNTCNRNKGSGCRTRRPPANRPTRRTRPGNNTPRPCPDTECHRRAPNSQRSCPCNSRSCRGCRRHSNRSRRSPERARPRDRTPTACNRRPTDKSLVAYAGEQEQRGIDIATLKVQPAELEARASLVDAEVQSILKFTERLADKIPAMVYELQRRADAASTRCR